MSKKRLLYIINPKSGVKRKTDVIAEINSLTDRNKYDFEIVHTKVAKQATDLSRQAAQNNYDIVAAVGGDGSVNEVAKGLMGSKTALAIIPMGSGNGMARHLEIPI